MIAASAAAPNTRRPISSWEPTTTATTTATLAGAAIVAREPFKDAVSGPLKEAMRSTTETRTMALQSNKRPMGGTASKLNARMRAAAMSAISGR